MKRYTIGLTGALILLLCMVASAQDASSYGTAPQPQMSMTRGGDLLSVCSNDTTLAMFIKHIKKSNLTQVLQGAGPITIFAPDNRAFNNRTKEDIDEEHKDSTVLISTMNYHLLVGKALSADEIMKMNGQAVTMNNGMQLPIQLQGTRVLVGNAHVIKGDIQASNGVIHIIDRVEIPGKVVLSAKTKKQSGT